MLVAVDPIFMSPVGSGWQSYTAFSYILIYMRELLRDRLWQKHTSEPKCSRGRLSGQTLFGKQLKSMKKNLFSALAVLQYSWGWFCDLEPLFLMFKLLCYCKSRLYGELYLRAYFHRSIIYCVRQWKSQPPAQTEWKKVKVECRETPSTFLVVTVIELVSAGRVLKGSAPPPLPNSQFFCTLAAAQGLGSMLPAGWVCAAQVYWRDACLGTLCWLSRITSWMPQKAQSKCQFY